MQQQRRVKGFFANGSLGVVALLLLPSLSLAASFEGLGHDGVPVALTDDGLQIWGECDGSAACSDGWRWSPAQGLVEVPFIPKAVTGDGAYATGEQGDSVIRWTTATGAVDVLASPGEFAAGCGSPWQFTGGPDALAISDDGETVIFWVNRNLSVLNPVPNYPWQQPPPWCAVYSSVWLKTVGQERENFFLFWSNPFSSHTLVAASVEQESVAVTSLETFEYNYGEVWSKNPSDFTRRSDEWEVGGAGPYINFEGGSLIYAMAGNGVAVAGEADGRAAIWPGPEAGGMQYLNNSLLPVSSRVTGLSHAADRAVGLKILTPCPGCGAEAPGSPFFWSRETGFLPLSDLLASVGVDVTGWNLDLDSEFLEFGQAYLEMRRRAPKISDDGTTIVGFGTNPDGDPEVWRVVLPDLASIPLPAQPPIVFSPYPRTKFNPWSADVYVDETGVVNYPIEASDPNGDALSFSMQGSPLLSIDPSTGVISGALTVPPNYNYSTRYEMEVTVSDGGLETVVAINFYAGRPNFVAPDTRFAEEGTSVSFTPEVGYPAPGISWSATGLPSRLIH